MKKSFLTSAILSTSIFFSTASAEIMTLTEETYSNWRVSALFETSQGFLSCWMTSNQYSDTITLTKQHDNRWIIMSHKNGWNPRGGEDDPIVANVKFYNKEGQIVKDETMAGLILNDPNSIMIYVNNLFVAHLATYHYLRITSSDDFDVAFDLSGTAASIKRLTQCNAEAVELNSLSD